MKRFLFALILTIVSLTEARADGPHQHRGFFLRMHLGPSYMHAAADNDSKLSGPGATLGVAVGGALAENLVLFGEVFGDSAMHPDVTFAGFSSDLTNANASLVGIGPGATYYFMPLNLYLSGSVTITHLRLTADELPEDHGKTTGPGIGMNLMVGKEWWVSANWGLGLAAQFAFAAAMTGEDIGGSDAKWNAIGGGVVFSSTYN